MPVQPMLRLAQLCLLPRRPVSKEIPVLMERMRWVVSCARAARLWRERDHRDLPCHFLQPIGVQSCDEAITTLLNSDSFMPRLKGNLRLPNRVAAQSPHSTDSGGPSSSIP